MKFSWYQILGSFIFPIRIEKRKSDRNKSLEISLYKNQVMLSTPSAIYSQGLHYTPFLIPFNIIKNELSHVNNFLLLGAGLGSALLILEKKMNCFPTATLVDSDSEIIKLSKQYNSFNNRENVTWVCMDAAEFIQQNMTSFDLIGIDVFQDMFVPNQITKSQFLIDCKNRLTNEGIIVMNYVPHHENHTEELEIRLHEIFTKVRIIPYRQNVFYILKP